MPTPEGTARAKRAWETRRKNLARRKRQEAAKKAQATKAAKKTLKRMPVAAR